MSKEYPEWAEWMDLGTLSKYADVCNRTLREWIGDVTDPLPASRVRGKILVRRSAFDEWMSTHKLTPNSLVDEIMNSLDKA